MNNGASHDLVCLVERCKLQCQFKLFCCFCFNNCTMDDDMEDELFHQTYMALFKLLSHVIKSSSRITLCYLENNEFMATLMFVLRQMMKSGVVIGGILLFGMALFTTHNLNSQVLKKSPPWFCIPAQFLIKKLRLTTVGLRSTYRHNFRIFTKASDLVSKSIAVPTILNSGSKDEWEIKQNNFGLYAIRGRRTKMEDRFDITSYVDKKNDKQIEIYGVYDGHGGDSAAEFVKDALLKNILIRVETEIEKDANYSQMLIEEILAVDKKLLDVLRPAKDVSGTTALVAIVDSELLVVANVGDSRGVVCDGRENAIPVSFDHKPQQSKEQKRIKQAGGFVAFNGVWRVVGILATSRALGDYPLKDRDLIIAEPDVLVFKLKDLKPEFLILASDGLWDKFSNEEAVAFIKERLHEPDYGAKSITNQAYLRGSLDNITVMVIRFKN